MEDNDCRKEDEQLETNRAHIAGIFASNFVKSHEQGNRQFYKSVVAVPRSSGTNDFIPIVIDKDLIDGDPKDVIKGVYIELWGRFCSFAKYEADEKKIERYIFVTDYILSDGKYDLENPIGTNEFFMNGEIKGDPIYRETPLGRTITEFCALSFRKSKKADRIPCIAWGRDAMDIAEYGSKTTIQLNGRIQSRPYLKKCLNDEDQIVEIEKTAYEVSVREYAIISECARKEQRTVVFDPTENNRVYA